MRVVSLSSSAGRIDFGGDIRLMRGLEGTGLPPVSVQWSEGAGDGARYRGARVGRRVLTVPIKITGVDRSAVLDRLSTLSRIIAPAVSPVRLRMQAQSADWYVDLVRVGGGDFSWSDTDGQTIVYTTLEMEAGDPFWTRETESSRLITPGGLGRGLIQGASLSTLQVSTTTGLGVANFSNVGDVAVFPRWIIRAPFTGFLLEGPAGDVIEWTAVRAGVAPLIAGFISVDAGTGIVRDDNGVNMYRGLNDVPRFWSIPPGASSAQVVAYDPGEGTAVDVRWNPKRWVMF